MGQISSLPIYVMILTYPNPGWLVIVPPTVLDLSHWSSVGDLNAAAASGVVGVIHKATEGSDYYDPTYEERRAAAMTADLLWGAYHFLRPGSMSAQATWFLQNTNPDDMTLLAIDYEDPEVTLADVKEFAGIVEVATKRRPVLYGGNVLKEQLGDGLDNQLARLRLWLAHYCAPPPSWPSGTWLKWWLWQYTEEGTCAGIDGSVDLSVYRGTMSNLTKNWAGKHKR